MELELFVLCIGITAAMFVYQSVRASKLKKRLEDAEFLVVAKDAIIDVNNNEIKMSRAIISAERSRKQELEDQVSMLVSQINQTGVKRNGKGRFEKVN